MEMHEKLKIIVVENSRLLRTTIADVLLRMPEVRIVWPLADCAELVETACNTDPHIIFVDLTAAFYRRETMLRVRTMFPDARLVILAEHADDLYLLDSVFPGRIPKDKVIFKSAFVQAATDLIEELSGEMLVSSVQSTEGVYA